MLLKWLGRTATFLLMLVFLLILFSAVSSRLNGGTPKVLGKELLSVLSGSMEPGIQTGSVIAVTPVPLDRQDSFQPGNVISYRSLDDPNSLITHRILRVENAGGSTAYITKGDNNDAEDAKPIPSTNVVAQYADFTVPYLGFFLIWIKTKAGIAVGMLAPGLIRIVSSLFTVFKAIVRMERDKANKASQSEVNVTNG